MKIELLWFEDCPNHEPTERMLREVLAEHGVSDEFHPIEVPDLETGKSIKFPGSPTIRIDGIDIDPGYEDTGDYTPRCRVYMTEAGLKGVPPREWIEQAVVSALEQRAAT